MSAVASDLEQETAALHSFRERPLPVKCNETLMDSPFGEIIKLVQDTTKLLQLQQEKEKIGVRMTPYELVRQYYVLPYDGYRFQVDTVNELSPLPRAGYYMDMGLGKTYISTLAALYKALVDNQDQILVIMPPVLITNWGRWFDQLRDVDGAALTITRYRGTPKVRKQLSLASDVILVGIQIFKKDYARFVKELGNKRVVVIVDEAHMLKNVGSDNHEKVRDFAADKHFMMLTGTPINSPGDAYGMVKLLAPGIYRNLHHFENVHVAERDFFDKPKRWRNLDLLKENLAVNSKRLLKEECIADMPPVTYQPLFYDLDPEHLKLYRRLAEEQLLQYKDGSKLDATSVQALFHALGQIVCNWAHFAQDEHKISEGFNLIDETLDALGDGKLVLFSNYKLTNRALVKRLVKYNPVAIYGDIGPSERDRAVDKFVDDPTCRVFIGNPSSAGYGIDRLQHVCSTVMFLEPPISVSAFTQALARVHRIGQTKPVTVKLATAVHTLQERQLQALMDKEELVQTLTRGYQSVREALGL